MPWNRFYYPAGSLSQTDKNAIAKGITDIYGENYPTSSTLVAFIPIEDGGFFKNGVATSNHFRITLQHMAGTYSVSYLENDLRMRFRDVWKPYVDDRGHTYELQIEEINGAEISFDSFIVKSLLADDLYKQMVEKNELYSLKTLKG